MFHAEHVYANQYGIYSENGDGEYTVLGVTAEEAEYGAMLMNEGALGDLSGVDNVDIRWMLEEAIMRVECVCGETVFAAELSSMGECPECVS